MNKIIRIFFMCFLLMARSVFSADITATLDTNNGTSGFSLKNSSSNTVAYIDSDGNMTLKGGLRLDSGGAECDTAEMLIVDGRLGIGMTGPEYPLHSLGGFSINGSSGSKFWSERNDSEFDIQVPSDSTKRCLSIHAATDGNSDNVLAVYAHNGSAYQSALFVDNNACVGIGTTTPSASLEVVGTAVFNVSGLDRDFRVAGDDDSTLLCTDAANDMVGIGTNAPGAKLEVNGDVKLSPGGGLYIYDTSGARYVRLLHSNNGNLHMNAFGGGTNYISWYGGSGLCVGNGSSSWGPVTASAYNIGSSARFKQDIRPMHYGLSDLLSLVPIEFSYKTDPDENCVGFLAEEVDLIYPEAVAYDTQELPLALDYSKFAPLIVKAMQEQQERIIALEAEISRLKQELADWSGR